MAKEAEEMIPVRFATSEKAETLETLGYIPARYLDTLYTYLTEVASNCVCRKVSIEKGSKTLSVKGELCGRPLCISERNWEKDSSGKYPPCDCIGNLKAHQCPDLFMRAALIKSIGVEKSK